MTIPKETYLQVWDFLLNLHVVLFRWCWFTSNGLGECIDHNLTLDVISWHEIVCCTFCVRIQCMDSNSIALNYGRADKISAQTALNAAFCLELHWTEQLQLAGVNAFAHRITFAQPFMNWLRLWRHLVHCAWHQLRHFNWHTVWNTHNWKRHICWLSINNWKKNTTKYAVQSKLPCSISSSSSWRLYRSNFDTPELDWWWWFCCVVGFSILFM